MPSKPTANSPGTGQETKALRATVARLERELKIEASLERVRARTMAMHRSTELGDVAAVLFQQLNELVSNLWTCGFVLCEKDRDEDEWWLGMDDGFTRGFFLPNVGDYTHATLYEGWKQGDDFRAVQLEGDALQEHYEWLINIPTARQIFEDMEAAGLQKPTWQKLHAAYFSKGYLCIITEMPCAEEEIFKRFAQVFDLTHTRFLDLKKAEAQAREAEIQLALERVRARTMAMHQSAELQEVINTVYEQLLELKLVITGGAFIAVNADIGPELACWGAGGSADYLQKVHIPLMDLPIYADLINDVQKGPGLYLRAYPPDEKQAFLRELYRLEPYRQTPAARKKEVMSRPGGYTRSCVVSTHTSIFIINHHGRPFSEEDNDILQRMGKVFEQTYTRFLDLQKAEAQAREAQIEAALERVRARTMAMHRSEQLPETAKILFEQFHELGKIPDRISIGIINEAKEVIELWVTDQSGTEVGHRFDFPFTETSSVQPLYRGWKAKKDAIVIDLQGETLKKWIRFVREEVHMKIDETHIRGRRVHHGAFFSRGFLLITTHQPIEAELMELLKRFAKVFDQTYTRFLDLQKAEAQAREAQIEAALERIRARAMAMHGSDELNDVLSVLFEQFDVLGINPVWAHLSLVDLENNTFTYRMTGRSGKRGLTKQVIDLNAREEWKESLDNFRKGKPNSVSCVEYEPGALPQIWALFDETLSALPDEAKVYPEDFPDGLFNTQGYCKFGYIGFNHNRRATEEEKSIVARIATEFGRIYQRYLDIEKAEAQAREAQIEAALERIRARSMAMHSSEELNDVLRVMFEQIEVLGIDAKCAHLTLMDPENNAFSFRITGKNGAANIGEQIIDLNAMPLWRDTVSNWKKAKPHSHQCLVYPPEILPDLWKLIATSLKTLPVKERIKITDFPNGVFDCEGHNKFGYIGFNNSRPPTDEEISIVIRFAREFERVYQRFLDIEKAEAQAREAQIEAALEKVRSQSLAMHATAEMQLVANAVYEQLRALGLEMDVVGMSGAIEAKKDYDVWVGGAPLGSALRIPYNEDTKVQRDYNKMLKDRPELFARTYSGKVKKEYIDRLLTHGEFPPVLRKKMETSDAFTTLIAPKKNSGIQLVRYSDQPFTERDAEILKRFAAVFEQAYIRFMDLEKAEAQARESQIEMALEKVRSRTMAMHQSGELGEVASVMFEQISELTNTPDRFNIGITNEADESIDIWVTDQNGQVVNQLFVARADKSPVISAFFNARKTKKTLAMDLHGKALKEWVQYMNKEVGIPFKEEQLKEHRYINSVFFSHGFIGVTTNEPLAQETVALIGRFARVFQQTYVRFLDLQKAESQAREARIEAALERVRAASMAMHKTDDIGAVVVVFFDQLKQLNIPFEQAWITIFHLEEGYLDTWFSPIDGIYPAPTYFKLPSGPWEETAIKSWKSDAPFAYMSLGTKVEVDQFLEACDEITDSNYFTHSQKKLRNHRLEFLEARHNYGFISKTSKEKPTKEDEEVLQRFAKVFEQTYTRFLDIQKAEGQARESQIQLSLERVRARSLAMQTSDELHEVLGILFQQFDKLGIQPVNVFLSLFDREARTLTYRASGKSGTRIPAQQVVQVDSMEPLKAIYDKWIHDNSDKVEVIYYPKEVLPELFGIFADTFASMPEEDRMGPDDFPDGGYSMAGYTPFGYLGYDHQRKATEEEKDILSRFCVEFTRVYRRFLDLQKAEAHAREAQIEAALEKVRSRSLAMQKPDEMQEVVTVVGEKLRELGVILDSGGVVICTYFPDSKDVMHWTATFDATHPSVPYYLPYFDSPIWIETWASKWESEDDFFEKVFSYEDKNHFFLHAFEHSDYKKLPEEYKKELLAVENHALSFAWQPNSALMIPSHNGKLLPEEHKTILKRFAKVFEQAYIRFMDLQRAEEQARESKIEMALEKVRSRTMAMHQSEELGEVAAVLFEQISTLTYAPERFNIAIGNKEEETFDIWVTDQKGHEVSKRFMFQVNKSPVVREVFNAWEKEPYIVQDLHGKKLKEWVRYMREEIGLPFDEARLSEHRYINSVFFSHGCIGITTNEPPEEEMLELISRFAKVFQQTYVRFLDLQKAEAQARESQIEVALERVRSRAMAMHHSDELTDVLGVLFDQFDFLGINPVLTHLTLFDEENETFTLRITTGGEKRTIAEQLIDVNAVESWKTSFANWKKSELHAVDCIDYPAEVLPAVWEVLNEVMNAIPEGQKIYPEDFPNGLYTTQGHCKYGYIGFNHSRRATEEEKDIVIRFAKEFGRLYQRFLDIQKAELQAREARIEAALERVRAKTMAMHNTDDIAATVTTFFNELLGLDPDSSIRCGVGILSQSEHMKLWTASVRDAGQTVLHAGTLDMSIHPLLKGVKENWARKGTRFSYTLQGKDLQRYFQSLNDATDYPAQFDLKAIPKTVYHHSFVFRDGILFVFTDTPLPDDIRNILERFAVVFGQTYTRFLDLQQAEKRAREAQIETALERVRARTMAMHKSEELGEVAAVLFEQLNSLGATLERLNIGIVREKEEFIEWWSTEQGGRQIDHLFKGSIHEPTTLSKVYTAWKKGIKRLELDQTGPELEQWIRYVQEVIGLPFDPELIQERRVQSTAFFKHGMLLISSPEPLPADSMNLLERFSAVFEQTYTRFLDLQKAEAQAREAQIEAALERVRAKTMAMHNTEDIGATVLTFFEELVGLGLDHSMRLGIGILSQSEQMKFWTATINEVSQTILQTGFLDMSNHPLLVGAKKAWAQGFSGFNYRLEGEDVKIYFQTLNNAPEVPAEFDLTKLPPTVHHQSYVFGDGILYSFTDAAIPEEISNIMERFAAVFGQTYTRYLDLEKAEQRAREAVRQASIERVRGEIASMRSTADLERITPLIWNELTSLGVPFFRCGVFIVDEKEEKIHSYLSNPKGESLAVWHVGFGLISVFDDMVKSWQKQEVFLTEWDRQGFIDFYETLIDHGLVDDHERYQSGAEAPEHLVLHMMPFAQGMLYVGSQAHLNPVQMDLVRALADSFSVAYARYEDFNQLEKALSELKATQAQLIQSEKMASLGELTAGIAHEIKNPLNFVNNFSEVSRELLEELVEELDKGDLEEVKALARDVSENLEKIVHHGMRADGIVKGMLQHSRSGDGKKEPTDLNALADEYLRLAYHGLRAKDKSFNATLETDFDPGAGLLELIPQDMGRVILNLLTNAFYAVSEKAREGRNGYVPTVSVKTARDGGRVSIAVSDNGNGIPEKVREKIFQPFFTTKPTGEGTGLGLSMSYDIVTKGHGGTLEVMTESGVGTTFVIKLNTTL